MARETIKKATSRMGFLRKMPEKQSILFSWPYENVFEKHGVVASVHPRSPSRLGLEHVMVGA